MSSTVLTSARLPANTSKLSGRPSGGADQADANLFIAAALIARVTALGLRIALRLALEVGARHIVEQKLEAHAKPLPVTRHQVGAQSVLVLAELIERAVEPVIVDQPVVHTEQIIERGGVIPVLGHSEFRALRAKTRDGKQSGGMRPAHRLAALGQKLAEQLIELETVPKREGEVTLAEVAAAFYSQSAQISRLPTRCGVTFGLARQTEPGQRCGVRLGDRSFPAQQCG